MTVDINCDLGESFGRYSLGLDREILPFVSSVNIACGYHAGDPLVMDRTVRMAAEAGVGVGAHPGFPDLMGFGRRNMAASPAEVRGYVLYQLGALEAFCRPYGVTMTHVKPHGALYNMAASDPELAGAVCEAVGEFDSSLVLLGLSGSVMMDCAAKKGVPSASEVFCDRAYEEDGALRPRSSTGALITEEGEAVARAVRMVCEGKVRAYSGRDISLQADSVCVHGDGERALAFAQKIRHALEEQGVIISGFRRKK